MDSFEKRALPDSVIVAILTRSGGLEKSGFIPGDEEVSRGVAAIMEDLDDGEAAEVQEERHPHYPPPKKENPVLV